VLRLLAAFLVSVAELDLQRARFARDRDAWFSSNWWLAPHNANGSIAAAERLHENTIRQLLDSLASSGMIPLTKREWES